MERKDILLGIALATGVTLGIVLDALALWVAIGTAVGLSLRSYGGKEEEQEK